MSQRDIKIMHSIKQLAKNECANYAKGFCLDDNRPCHVLNPAYKTIHGGAVACDYYLSAVLPLDMELNRAVRHEIDPEESRAGEGWKVCVRCQKSFISRSNRQRYCASCGSIAKQIRSREKQRRYRERQKKAV